MIDFKTNGFHALKQMSNAMKRGDLDTAFKWALLADRQLKMARRISDLRAERHRPKPLPPRPEPAPPAPAKSTAARKPAKKTESSPAAEQPKPFCPHSRLPGACFCKNGPPA